MKKGGSRIGSRKLVSTGKAEATEVGSGVGKPLRFVQPTDCFLILSERLKDAAKLKANKKYHDRDFDKLVDAL